jgi:predicted enzyme related to lactoylglutathione lyase
MTIHPIVHIEIPLPNPAENSAFYAQALGWKVESTPGFDYTQFVAEGGPGGGFVGTSQEGWLRYEVGKPLIYLGSTDIDASLSAVTAYGGKIILNKTEIPHVGWFAMFSDPSGNQFAFFTSAR